MEDYNQEEYQAIEPDLSEGTLPSQDAAPAPQEEQPQDQEPQAPQQPVSVPEGDENDIPDDLPEDPQKQREAFIKMRQALKAQKQPAPVQQVEEVVETDPLLQELLTWTPGLPGPQTQFDMNDPMAQAVSEHFNAAREEAHLARQETANLKAELEKLQANEQYPEMKSNKLFAQRVQEKLTYLSLRATQEGKPRPTMAQAAKQVKTEFGQLNQETEQAALEQATQTLQTKQQATLSQGPATAQVIPAKGTNQYKERINRGDESALQAALMEDELANLPDSFFSPIL
jgi:hypothetical protein